MVDLEKVLRFVLILFRLNRDVRAGHECFLRSTTFDPGAVSTVTPVIANGPSVLEDKETRVKTGSNTKSMRGPHLKEKEPEGHA